ncbi:MAG: 7-cyano-7-deazaguanine synthase QueC [Candidatus Marinimicrobia bacterium]|jgi:7-cyano-7-deazaguanine synthase|nr:7-cyano-7-deazaguanine synthase QueC [Candidatus Neomarinimicrobiota bacterium]MBO69941.1 7-cyano-7-deazaguanine synthase QueC [Candidatus Neomarinimicrobiota bacterium]MEC8706233.1 7-cyano-7-deazaguanine synthase QueC [Candidatus Neomarinimicrobiota bacterium]|tara:strand:- start:10496 stop:11182 length:687 start_codon:yes stop_codon:yes gene_type:complete
MKKAVILLSGGLDSVTCLAIAKSKDYSLYALTFRYGQRHQFEIGAAKECALSQQVENHIIMDIDLRSFGGSALTDNIDVPKDRIETNITDDIPITYVPARNTIFLSFALAYSESIGCSDIFIGVNALDYSGYPDCRPEYISAFEAMSKLATKSGVTGKSSIKIHTPLIDMGKHEIIKTGSSLGVDYSITHSCYDPDKNGISCGRCDACTLRLKGFKKAGIADPIQYAN